MTGVVIPHGVDWVGYCQCFSVVGRTTVCQIEKSS